METQDQAAAAATTDGPLPKGRWHVVPERSRVGFKVKKFGLRNSLLIAIAPTATIASIVGCYEAIEPQISNLFKRETLSGEFLQINKHLVLELKKLGLWNEEIRTWIKLGEGSVQDRSSARCGKCPSAL